MTISELIAILTLVGGVWYWFDSMRVREIACMVSDANCKSKNVHFLDQSVVLGKIRLRRNPQGHLVLLRRYNFEFTSDGAYRYKGNISMLGKQAVNFEMEPYREEYSDNNLLN